MGLPVDAKRLNTFTSEQWLLQSCSGMPGPSLRNGLNLKIFNNLGQLNRCNLHSGISPHVEIPAFYSTLLSTPQRSIPFQR